MRQILPIISLLCLVVSCTQPGRKLVSDETPISSDTIEYARGFSITEYKEYTAVEVHNPWDTTKLLQRYILVKRDKALPEGLPAGTIVRTPVRKAIVYASVHASIIDQLGEIGNIIGVCEPQYMITPAIQEGLQKGSITNLGQATSPNIEKIIEIGAEVIITSPFQNTGYGQTEKLGIPIIEGADYMEEHPLGRAEWSRFFGLLFDKKTVGDSIFRETEKNYLDLKQLAQKTSSRPTVLTEMRYGSVWYVPSKDSYKAHLINDAGGRYIFDDMPGPGSIPLPFETVLDKAIHADIWLIKYNQSAELDYRNLKAEYTPYENFDAYKKRNIFACNTGKVHYYEEFPIHPDYLLKDLIWIFHPEILPDYTPRYYQKMK